MEFNITIKTHSPLELGAINADITIDEDIVYDEVGLPYFPAKRLRGLIKESAQEVNEMLSMANNREYQETLDEMVIGNFYLWPFDEYRKRKKELMYLQSEFGFIISPKDILSQYTSIRYQTALTDGVATAGSLHNMRVLNAGYSFYGTITLKEYKSAGLLALALRNLKSVGTKRHRGFGYIECSFTANGESEGKIIEEALVARGL